MVGNVIIVTYLDSFFICMNNSKFKLLEVMRNNTENSNGILQVLHNYNIQIFI